MRGLPVGLPKERYSVRGPVSIQVRHAVSHGIVRGAFATGTASGSSRHFVKRGGLLTSHARPWDGAR